MKATLQYGCWWAMIPITGFLAITLYFHGHLRISDGIYIVCIFPILAWVGTHIYKASHPEGGSVSDEETPSTHPQQGASIKTVSRSKNDARKVWTITLLALGIFGWLFFYWDELGMRGDGAVQGRSYSSP